jgi:hypothetical protein
MLRLLVNLALAGAFLVAVWTWVPIGGRTLAARWEAAPTAGAFARDAVAELTGESPRARTPGAQGRAAPRERPPERLTDAEREALDRRLAEELRREGAAR